jgi:hypothetical protein
LGTVFKSEPVRQMMQPGGKLVFGGDGTSISQRCE